jgi:hypothetical protein
MPLPHEEIRNIFQKSWYTCAQEHPKTVENVFSEKESFFSSIQ